MGPAGSVHMSLADLSTYATEHLRGQRGQGKLLSAETYQRLHTPGLNRYACGWILDEPRSDIRFPIYWHNGSNTMWYALVVFIPEKNMVVAVTSNDGDSTTAEAAAWRIVTAAAGDSGVLGFPKKSPFAAVRWQDSQPEVQVDDEWYKLVMFNELPAADIIAFSQKTYGDQWQKRFEEDLVELLTRMGHEPAETVTVVVETLASPPETHTFKDVPMTRANRQAIYEAAESRATP